MAGDQMVLVPTRLTLDPPEFYKKADADADKPYDIDITVLASSQQYAKSYTTTAFDPKAVFKGGQYTYDLLKKADTTTSFLEAHQGLEKQAWQTRYDYETHTQILADTFEEHKKQKAKLAAETPEHADLLKLDTDFNAKSQDIDKRLDAEREKETPDYDVIRTLGKERQSLLRDYRGKRVPLEVKLENHPKIKALTQQQVVDFAKLSKENRALAAKTQLNVETDLPLPVSSKQTTIKGWQPGDKNPRTALLIQGNGNGITDDSVDAMKQTLMKDYGLQEADINIAKTQEDVEAAFKKMKQFGEDNKDKAPAAMVYYMGHGAIDGHAKYTPGAAPDPREDGISITGSQGQLRGMLQIPVDEASRKDGGKAFLHEYQLKEMINTNLKPFDGRALMILDTCFSGSLTAKAEDPLSRYPTI